MPLNYTIHFDTARYQGEVNSLDDLVNVFATYAGQMPPKEMMKSILVVDLDGKGGSGYACFGDEGEGNLEEFLRKRGVSEESLSRIKEPSPL